MINPFHLSGISKKVYIRLYKYIYFYYLNTTSDLSQSEDFAIADCEVDFNGQPCLSFMDFYNGLFECTDFFTKSFLASEYVRFVLNLKEKLESCFWFNGLDLHNKLHVDCNKQQFSP